VRVDAKYRIEHHFLVRHMALDEVPFYCTLCQFRAFKREELEQHTTSFKRHKAVREEKQVEDCPRMLVTCKEPYVITRKDIMPLSAEESKRHWASRQQEDILQQALSAALSTDEDSLAKEVEQMAAGGVTGQSNAQDKQPGTVRTNLPSPAFEPTTTPAAAQTSTARPGLMTDLTGSQTTPAATMPFQPLSPVIEASQILQPLQQLVSLFGGGLTSPAVTSTVPQATDVNAASQTPAALQQENVAQVSVGSYSDVPTQTSRKGSMQPPVVPHTYSPRAQSPVPSLPESAGVFANMPSREECKALDRSTAPSSSSSDSSAESACGHHEQILKEIQELKSSVQNFEGHFLRQCASFQDLATKLLHMARNIATPAQRQPLVVPAATAQGEGCSQYPPYVPTAAAAQRQHERGQRDRSPLRKQDSKENRPRNKSSHHGNRRDDSRDGRRDDRPDFQDRRNVNYRR